MKTQEKCFGGLSACFCNVLLFCVGISAVPGLVRKRSRAAVLILLRHLPHCAVWVRRRAAADCGARQICGTGPLGGWRHARLVIACGQRAGNGKEFRSWTAQPHTGFNWEHETTVTLMAKAYVFREKKVHNSLSKKSINFTVHNS